MYLYDFGGFLIILIVKSTYSTAGRASGHPNVELGTSKLLTRRVKRNWNQDGHAVSSLLDSRQEPTTQR